MVVVVLRKRKLHLECDGGGYINDLDSLFCLFACLTQRVIDARQGNARSKLEKYARLRLHPPTLLY